MDRMLQTAQEGDTVAEFDQLCEVQSDKAAVEITSQYAGIIRQLLHQPGDMVQVWDRVQASHTRHAMAKPAAYMATGQTSSLSAATSAGPSLQVV